MSSFLIKGTILATTFPGTNPGDTFTLTVVTDGFSGLCTVANGHLTSVTGSLDGTPYDITLVNGYPANPSFNPGTNALTGQGQLGAGGPFDSAIFTINSTSFSIEDEEAAATGTFPKRCLL
jgi:hypothetical protein